MTDILLCTTIAVQMSLLSFGLVFFNLVFSTPNRWNGDYKLNPYLMKSVFGQSEFDRLEIKMGDKKDLWDLVMRKAKYS